MSDETPESKWRSEMEQAFDELAQRQDGTDDGLEKLSHAVAEIDQMLRALLVHMGVKHG